MNPSNRPPPLSRTGGGIGRRYGFHCIYCSSRLEATEAMAGQEGQCPTCGSAITIPILDRRGRLIDPQTREVLKPDPHPVHAYAAAGERAPVVIRHTDGSQHIRCTKCAKYSPVSSNNCVHCGMPFTMEGTSSEPGGNMNGFAVASLILGIIGIPFAFTLIVPAVATLFGAMALFQISQQPQGTGRGQAIAGLSCGIAGLGLALLLYIR